MASIYKLTITLTFLFASDGFRTKTRFLDYNPGDLSTALGYQNHQVQDLTSLVNEASGAAHANGNVKIQNGPYNVPNFPAMGTNQIQSQTGTVGGTSSGNNPIVSGSNGGGQISPSGSGSASFPGTNQWRCDAHVVEKCDTQCLDVDPKDGCPFCIPACHLSTGGASSFGGQGVPSNSLTNGNGVQNQTQTPGTSAGGSIQAGNFGQNLGTLTGTAWQSVTGLGGNLIQQPSGLAGTSGNNQGTQAKQPFGLAGTGGNNQGIQAKQGTSGSSPTNSGTTTTVCPHFPPNCPKMYTAIDKNGCLDCTILSRKTQTTKNTVTTTSLPVTSRTCAPKRCVAPCNVGIVLDSNGCPQCRCPDHV